MSQHPMVPVPKALDMVLCRTAEVVLSSSLISDEGGSEEQEEQWESKRVVDLEMMRTDDVSILGRVMGQDVTMPSPGFPPFPASIMDGYAVYVGEESDAAVAPEISADARINHVQRGVTWTHEVVGSVFAGKYEHQWSHDVNVLGEDSSSDRSFRGRRRGRLPHATYVTTGAVVPAQYNAVVPIEECVLSSTSDRNDVDGGIDDSVVYLSIRKKGGGEIKAGEWIRPVGCDIAPNAVILKRGDEIGPPEVALLAQCGLTDVAVKRKPRVGVLSTGNEVQPLPTSSSSSFNTNMKTGLIYDANRPSLLSLISEASTTGIDLGVATDDLDILEQTLIDGLISCDVVITSGGISMGDKDLLEEVLVQRLGAKVHFGRLHMKPGKPTTFLTWNGYGGRTKLIFALPGNPVSAMVCFHLLVYPALDLLRRGGDITDEAESVKEGRGGECTAETRNKRMEERVRVMADNAIVHSEVHATLSKDTKLDQERPEYHRVALSWVDNELNSGTGAIGGFGGHYVTMSTGTQRSSRLLSMRHANALLCLPQGLSSEKTVCKAGEKILALCIGKGMGSGIKWKDSRHGAPARTIPTKAKKKKKEIAVGVIFANVSTAKEDIKKKIVEPLGHAMILQTKTFSFDIHRNDNSKNSLEARGELLSRAMSEMSLAELVVVVAGGGFRQQLETSCAIRDCIPSFTKQADAMALQARCGAAGVHGLSALFEYVAGWCDGKLILCMPEDSVLASMEGLGSKLISHAIGIGKGHRSHMH